MNPEEIWKQTYLIDIKHPSYVYSSKFFPDASESQERLILVTACFDGKVRIWFLDISKDYVTVPDLIRENFLMIDKNRDEQELIDLRYPNTLRFGKKASDLLFIGDSKGAIHIWEIRVRKRIFSPEQPN